MSSATVTNAAPARPRRKWLLLLFSILLPLYGFGWLAEAVWNRNGLDCDVPALNLIHRYAMPDRDMLMVWVTRTGDVRSVILLAGVASLAFMRKQRRRDATFLCCAVGGALLLDWFVKSAIHRIRPHLWESPAPEFDFSFPSGHSTGTLALIVALVVIAWRTRWRYAAIFGGFLYVFCVGLSRLYLRVHYPSDVLGAWALAFAWVSGLSMIRDIPFSDLVRQKKCAQLVSGILGSLAAILGGYVSGDLEHNNLRVLVAGQAYRSGQMKPEQLARTIEHCSIKSILNLRGENPTTIWHQAEIATAAKMNLIHYDRSLSSGQELSLEQMDERVALLREAPKPVLIHCWGGADRSGLVSALYLFAVEDQSPREADKELSIWNGHVPLIRPKVTAMDHSFWGYVSNHVSHTELDLQLNLRSP